MNIWVWNHGWKTLVFWGIRRGENLETPAPYVSFPVLHITHLVQLNQL